MVSRNKLYAQLDELEQELLENLIPYLKLAIGGRKNYIFCVSDFNTHEKMKAHLDSNTQNMVKVARKIILLKEKLGESVEGSIAERICWYCRKWNDLPNPSASDNKMIAKQFLEEITSKIVSDV